MPDELPTVTVGINTGEVSMTMAIDGQTKTFLVDMDRAARLAAALAHFAVAADPDPGFIKRGGNIV